MARKRKPCEFCSDSFVTTDYIEGKNGFCLWIEIYPFNQFIAAIAQANDEDGAMIEGHIDLPMNFCPNCGRDLRKETD